MSLRDRLLELEETGVELWRTGDKLSYRAPVGRMDDETRSVLATHKSAILALLDIDSQPTQVVSNPDAPFPLTPLQEAYLIGRSNGLFLGGVGCHAYGELELAIDYAPALPQAFAQLVGRHPMLRARLDRNGLQRISAKTGPVVKVRNVDAAAFDAVLEDIRSRLSHKLYAPGDQRYWNLEALCQGGSLRICLSIDFVIADFESIATMLNDLDDLLAGRPLPPLPALGFADHVQAQRHRREGLRWARDRAWWLDRAGAISARLWRPTVQEKRALDNAPARFRRLARTVPGPVDPPAGGIGAAALAAYAESLGLVVSGDGWLVNATASGRSNTAHEIRDFFGNLSTTALLPVSRREPDERFEDWSRALNDRLLDAIGHLSFGGVEVLRAIRGPETVAALAPFVFTNMLRVGKAPGTLTAVHAISQTPQTLIDCQIGRGPEGLEVSWDVREGFRTAAEIEQAFDTFVCRLCQRPVGIVAAPIPASERYRAAVLALPGVETVRFELQGTDGIRLATQISTQSVAVGNGSADRLLERLRGLSFPASGYGDVLQRLDDFALAEMIDLMRRRHLDIGAPLRPETVADALRTVPTMRALTERWLGALVHAGFAVPSDHNGIRLSSHLPPPPSPADWSALRDMAGEAEPRAVLDYFRLCGLSLGEVICGAADPARLFFPNGTLSIASALFGGSRMSKDLHEAAGTLAAAMADAAERPLRVLEIGSGTGATALAALSALGTRPVRWTATDVNPTMLSHLERIFADDPRVDVRKVDMDLPPAWHGVTPGSVDLVVAGDALHLAADPETTLRFLRDRIAPGGALLMIEMCAQRPQVMITLETIYATQGRGHTSPFRDTETWCAMLVAAGFGTPETVPHADSGQQILAAPARKEAMAPDCEAILSLAQYHLGVAPRAHAIFLEHEEFRLPEPATPQPSGAVDEPLSKERLAAITALLPEDIKPLAGPGATMQALGMDSLLAAQFTGRLLERFSSQDLFFDDILSLLLNGSSLVGLERYLAGERDADRMPGEKTAAKDQPDLLVFGPPDAELSAILARSGLVISADPQAASMAVKLILGIGGGSGQAAMTAIELSETGAQTKLLLWHPDAPPAGVFLTVDVAIFARNVLLTHVDLWRAATLGDVTTHLPSALGGMLVGERLSQ